MKLPPAHTKPPPAKQVSLNGVSPRPLSPPTSEQLENVDLVNNTKLQKQSKPKPVSAPVEGFLDVWQICCIRKGSIMPKICLHCLLSVVFSLLGVAGLSAWNETLEKVFPKFGPTFHSMIAMGVAFLLVFRSNIAYSRFWEARGHVGGAIESVRAMAIMIDGTIQMSASKGTNQYCVATKKYIRILLCNFASMTIAQLRKENLSVEYVQEFWQLLPPKVQRRVLIAAQSSAPVIIINELIRTIVACEHDGLISIHYAKHHIIKATDLITAFNGAVKIATCKMPVPYQQMCSWLTITYCYTAPLVIATADEEYATGSIWFAGRVIACAVFLSVCFFGINEIAVELEDPFGDDQNDLPLRKYFEDLRLELVHTINEEDNHVHLTEMLDDAQLYKGAAWSKVVKKMEPENGAQSTTGKEKRSAAGNALLMAAKKEGKSGRAMGENTPIGSLSKAAAAMERRTTESSTKSNGGTADRNGTDGAGDKVKKRTTITQDTFRETMKSTATWVVDEEKTTNSDPSNANAEDTRYSSQAFAARSGGKRNHSTNGDTIPPNAKQGDSRTRSTERSTSPPNVKLRPSLQRGSTTSVLKNVRSDKDSSRVMA